MLEGVFGVRVLLIQIVDRIIEFVAMSFFRPSMGAFYFFSGFLGL
jgi:hypothetical protein